MELEKTDNNYSLQQSTTNQFTFSQPSNQRQLLQTDHEMNMDDNYYQGHEGETESNPEGFFSETNTAAACSVRVALRVRPLLGRELYESPNTCITCYPENGQLIIGKDRAFTFDKVFDIGTNQEQVFELCVKNLVLGCFQGYNATVLAYGQTGSGKTHTMGSGYTIGLKDEDLGIIPRVIKLIFQEVEKRKDKAEFIIKCTFLEIYNEEFHDLLDQGNYTSGQSSSASVMDRFMQKKDITIREEKNGNISVYGLREDKVNCYEELAACLDRGSNFRSTASTMMNNCSSRSHAIFTISIEQHIIEDLYKPDNNNNSKAQQQMPAPGTDGAAEEFMVAKFHFVDLAGSERIKRTGATGTTMKEGISINKGLLSLGNVIAALTEEGKKMHIPYRDSKLTRILQDSLGGNSRTSMIACISPAEINFEETLNSLKYASRARNIKNKPIVNRDPNSAQIAQLRQQVYELSRELIGCRKVLISNNIEFEQSAILTTDALNNMGTDSAVKGQSSNRENQQRSYTLGAQEMSRLEQEIKQLKIEKSSKEKMLQQSQVHCETVMEQLQSSQLESFQIQKERDLARFQIEQVTQILKKRNILEEVMNEMHGYNKQDQMEIDDCNNGESDPATKGNYDFLFGASGPCILEEYQVKVEEQKKELGQKNSTLKQLQKDYENLFQSSQSETRMLESKEAEIERLKRSVNKIQKENVQLKTDQRRGSRMPAGPTSNNLNANQLQQQQLHHGKPTDNAKKQLSPFGAAPNKKKANHPFTDASNNQWLSTELDYNIKHFHELFIENLSQSLSTILVAKKPNSNEQAATNKEGEDEKEQTAHQVSIIDNNDIEMHKNDQAQDESDSEQSEDEQENNEEEEQIDEETKIQAQKEAIECNEENKKQDLEMQMHLENQEQQIGNLDGDLKNKEGLLEAIKESHKMLQNNLLEAMKNEYHKKIQQLDLEVRQLEKERSENLKKAENAQQKNKVEDCYKKKMKDLDDKLKDLKKKDQEQTGMMKESTKQKMKIKTLEGEIEKVKSQKVGLMKRIKEESENHRKWKNDRGMELIKMKSANSKKDREIEKLKRENVRKDIFVKRKQDELTALQKKTKNDKQKKINADKVRMKKKNIDIGRIQGWIMSNTDKMLQYKELSQLQQQEQAVSKEVEELISEEQNQFGVLTVRKRKLEIKKAQLEGSNGMGDNFEEEIYQISEDVDQLDLEMKAIQDNVESLEEKQDFVSQKLSSISTQLVNLSPDDIEQLRFDEVQSIEGARACLGAFFGILLDVNVYKKQLENQTILNEATIGSLKSKVDDLTNMQRSNEMHFQKQMEQINREYREKEEMMMRIIMENGGVDMESLLNSSDGTNPFRQYLLHSNQNLKNKDNEILDRGITPSQTSHNNNQPQMFAGSQSFGTYSQNAAANNHLKKASTLAPVGSTSNKASEQVKKSKELQYNQSKTALSKRVAELERKNRDEEKKLESMRHKFEQSNQEKDQFKRQLDNFKQKIKTQEIQEVKNLKVAANEENGANYNQSNAYNNNNNNNNNVKSPRTHNQQSVPPDKQGKLITLYEVRKERKMKKLGSQPAASITKQQLNSEPKVIADEPMEDDDDGVEIESPTINDRKNTISMGGYKPMVHQNSEQVSVRNNESEQTNVFSRLSQGKKPRNHIPSANIVQTKSNSLNTSQSMQLQAQGQDNNNYAGAPPQIMTAGFDDDHKWKCLLSKESAHNGQICALASVGNQLYSTSNKSLKIWDLDTMTNVSDIQAHSGFIKCMTIWENKNLLLTASDKVIMLWDLISLTNVGVLKGHKDEIRAMNVTQDGHILFSGGKGSANGGALLLWDLRKGAMPFEEKEKQQDIFSLASTKDYLFYGCRNHQVYPMNLKTYEIMHPFDPPHFDVVTSLAILDNTLVSGSRDKNLRCWDPFSTQLQNNKYSDVMQAHSDWINSMETDYDKKEMYSGGKDGVVKVWRIRKRKLKCMAGLSSNSGQINCLSKIDRGFGKMFAQGSSDKSIRMWKFKDKYLNEEQFEDQNNSYSPDGVDADNNNNNNNNNNANMDDDEYFSQNHMNNNNNDIIAYGGDYNDGDSQGEIENQIFSHLDKKEELKQHYQQQNNNNNNNNEVYKYQPVRQNAGANTSSYSSITSNNPSQKLQQMRRQKRLQENQKRQQKENEVVFQRSNLNE